MTVYFVKIFFSWENDLTILLTGTVKEVSFDTYFLLTHSCCIVTYSLTDWTMGLTIWERKQLCWGLLGSLCKSAIMVDLLLYQSQQHIPYHLPLALNTQKVRERAYKIYKQEYCNIHNQLHDKLKCLNYQIAPKIFSLFQAYFSFFKQIKKIGVEGFWNTFHPNFCICLYVIGVGGDENLKNI